MSLNKLLFALVGGVLLAGCVYVPLGKVPQLTAGSLAAAGKASLVVAPRLKDGTFATQPESFSTQAVVEPYTRTDVQHVLIALFKVEGGTESAIVDPKGIPITRDLPMDAMERLVTFSDLHPNTTYRVRAFAFQAAGTASADVISEVASSTLEVRVEGDEKPTTADLAITLKDKAFNGVASPSIGFDPGGYLTGLEGFR